MKAHHLKKESLHVTSCPAFLEPEASCTCSHYRRSSSGSGQFGPTQPPVKYDTEPTKTVDKQAFQSSGLLNPTIMGSLTKLAGIIEVPVMDGCKNPYGHIETKHHIGCPASYEDAGKCICEKSKEPGTKVAFRHVFTVSGHDYLFTSSCCTNCLKLKHKKMLRAYLIHHGMKPGSIKLWFKVWRATK